MVVQSEKNSEIILIRGSSLLPHGRFSSNVASPPIGLAYLAGYLIKQGNWAANSGKSLFASH